MARIEHREMPHRDAFTVTAQASGVMFVATKPTTVHQVTTKRLDATPGNLTLTGENPGAAVVDILPTQAMTATDEFVDTSDPGLVDLVNQVNPGDAAFTYDLDAAGVSEGFEVPFVLQPGGQLDVVISAGLVIVTVMLGEAVI